jgi:hypothetical protein
MQQSRKTWVEFHGGPYDGTMAEMADPFDGLVVYAPREELPDGRHRVGPARGRYVRGGKAVEDLDVIRMDWSHDVPEDLRLMEGRAVGRRNEG